MFRIRRFPRPPRLLDFKDRENFYSNDPSCFFIFAVKNRPAKEKEESTWGRSEKGETLNFSTRPLSKVIQISVARSNRFSPSLFSSLLFSVFDGKAM